MNEQRILDFLKDRQGQRLPSLEEMASEMNLSTEETTELIRHIENMELTGTIIKTKKGRIALPENMGFFSGRIQLHQRGFGFLIMDADASNKTKRDIFIPPDKTMNAMNGDTVLVKAEVDPRNPDKVEGEVTKIVSRNTTTVIGVYQQNPNFGFVLPEDKKIRDDIFINKGDSLTAKNDDVVVVELTKFPSKGKSAEGKIINVLGRKGDPGVDMLTILTKFNLPQEFPDKVLEAADNIVEGIPQEEMDRRRDLREEVIVTIDGADAKDLDDAITVTKLDDGNYKLGVHIADVSHYVPENGIIDEEAIKRATSVYLIDLVLPMLPQKLSNNLCSLNPDTDKLALSCEMIIDANGSVKSSEVFESLIRSSYRLTYDDVNAILEKDDAPLKEKYQAILPLLYDMRDLYAILNKKRMNRGAIDFDFTESFIELNEKGEPVDVRPFIRGVGNRIIEEFMLAANETVAETYFWQKIPFIYRIHEDPDPEKLQAFSESANIMGVPLRFGKDVEPKDLQTILAEVKGTPSEHVLSKLLLRSMMQAKYSPQNLGHFGLAAKYYCHFTSPIRRYPDLQIHRIIKWQLQGELTGQKVDQLKDRVKKAADISSDLERVAEEAEREVDDLKKTQYMHAHLGEEYEGVVSGVTNFGFFVELANTIEGLVHINTLPEDMAYDERRMILSGSSGSIRLGEKVRIRVDGAKVDEREIDFSFLGKIDEEGNFEARQSEPRERKPLLLGNFRKNAKDRQQNPGQGKAGRGKAKGKPFGKKGFGKKGKSKSKR